MATVTDALSASLASVETPDVTPGPTNSHPALSPWISRLLHTPLFLAAEMLASAGIFDAGLLLPATWPSSLVVDQSVRDGMLAIAYYSSLTSCPGDDVLGPVAAFLGMLSSVRWQLEGLERDFMQGLFALLTRTEGCSTLMLQAVEGMLVSAKDFLSTGFVDGGCAKALQGVLWAISEGSFLDHASGSALRNIVATIAESQQTCQELIHARKDEEADTLTPTHSSPPPFPGLHKRDVERLHTLYARSYARLATDAPFPTDDCRGPLGVSVEALRSAMTTSAAGMCCEMEFAVAKVVHSLRCGFDSEEEVLAGFFAHLHTMLEVVLEAVDGTEPPAELEEGLLDEESEVGGGGQAANELLEGTPTTHVVAECLLQGLVDVSSVVRGVCHGEVVRGIEGVYGVVIQLLCDPRLRALRQMLLTCAAKCVALLPAEAAQRALYQLAKCAKHDPRFYAQQLAAKALGTAATVLQGSSPYLAHFAHRELQDITHHFITTDKHSTARACLRTMCDTVIAYDPEGDIDTTWFDGVTSVLLGMYNEVSVSPDPLLLHTIPSALLRLAKVDSLEARDRLLASCLDCAVYQLAQAAEERAKVVLQGLLPVVVALLRQTQTCDRLMAASPIEPPSENVLRVQRLFRRFWALLYLRGLGDSGDVGNLATDVACESPSVGSLQDGLTDIEGILASLATQPPARSLTAIGVSTGTLQPHEVGMLGVVLALEERRASAPRRFVPFLLSYLSDPLLATRDQLKSALRLIIHHVFPTALDHIEKFPPHDQLDVLPVLMAQLWERATLPALQHTALSLVESLVQRFPATCCDHRSLDALVHACNNGPSVVAEVGDICITAFANAAPSKCAALLQASLLRLTRAQKHHAVHFLFSHLHQHGKGVMDFAYFCGVVEGLTTGSDPATVADRLLRELEAGHEAAYPTSIALLASQWSPSPLFRNLLRHVAHSRKGWDMWGWVVLNATAAVPFLEEVVGAWCRLVLRGEGLFGDANPAALEQQRNIALFISEHYVHKSSHILCNREVGHLALRLLHFSLLKADSLLRTTEVQHAYFAFVVMGLLIMATSHSAGDTFHLRLKLYHVLVRWFSVPPVLPDSSAVEACRRVNELVGAERHALHTASSDPTSRASNFGESTASVMSSGYPREVVFVEASEKRMHLHNLLSLLRILLRDEEERAVVWGGLGSKSMEKSKVHKRDAHAWRELLNTALHESPALVLAISHRFRCPVHHLVSSHPHSFAALPEASTFLVDTRPMEPRHLISWAPPALPTALVLLSSRKLDAAVHSHAAKAFLRPDDHYLSHTPQIVALYLSHHLPSVVHTLRDLLCDMVVEDVVSVFRALRVAAEASEENEVKSRAAVLEKSLTVVIEGKADLNRKLQASTSLDRGFHDILAGRREYAGGGVQNQLARLLGVDRRGALPPSSPVFLPTHPDTPVVDLLPDTSVSNGRIVLWCRVDSVSPRLASRPAPPVLSSLSKTFTLSGQLIVEPGDRPRPSPSLNPSDTATTPPSRTSPALSASHDDQAEAPPRPSRFASIQGCMLCAESNIRCALLAAQVGELLYEAFSDAKLVSGVRPLRVVPCGPKEGLFEMSWDARPRRTVDDPLALFASLHGPPDSPSGEAAREALVESLAAHAVLGHVLNATRCRDDLILLPTGHVVARYWCGPILDSGPSDPDDSTCFKLPSEMIPLLDGFLPRYRLSCQRCFAVARRLIHRLDGLIAPMLHVLSCSRQGRPTIKELHDRLAIGMAEREAAKYLTSLLNRSAPTT
eukprot:Sspe_Gene.21702::Locus_8158_Transcript_1_1_Confidence_1.000_Length_6219::g.21702::m.21702